MLPSTSASSAGELFIVDNADSDWTGLRYLREWTEIATGFDIAAGYFEIGALLELEGHWQKLDRIRILMGDEASYRTRAALLEGLKQKITSALERSMEDEKARNDFLAGVPAIIEAIRTGKIQCRVYARRKFHAKAYITHSRLAVAYQWETQLSLRLPGERSDPDKLARFVRDLAASDRVKDSVRQLPIRAGSSSTRESSIVCRRSRTVGADRESRASGNGNVAGGVAVSSERTPRERKRDGFSRGAVAHGPGNLLRRRKGLLRGST